MSLENKFLEETYLTSTKNKYLEENLTFLECGLRECFLKSFGNEKFKSLVSGDYLLTYDVQRSKEKDFSKDEPPRKKKKKKGRSRCAPVVYSAKQMKAKMNLMAMERLNEEEESRSRSGSFIDEAMVLDTLDSFDEMGVQEAQGMGLRGEVSSCSFGAAPGSAFPQSSGEISSFSFGAAPNSAFLRSSGGTRSIPFGAAPAPPPMLFGSAAQVCTFGATSLSSRFPTSAIPAVIQETFIAQMPSYELDSLSLENEIDVNSFSFNQSYSSSSHEQSFNTIKYKKLHFLNIVSMALLYSSNLKDKSDAFRITLLKLADEIREVDPQFVLKVALYARQELQIRAVTNFLLSYASLHLSTRIYLEKYFGASIVLPTDWIQVAEYYETLKNETDCRSLPAALRSSMKKTFSKFDEYQLAKYNRKKSRKAKSKSLPNDDTTEDEQENKLRSKTFSLKNLIRTLHIDSPVEHVMCLLGKKYPETHAAFMTSGLPGNWDQSKSGQRMKLPIPETWETQVSSRGNKSSVWESLIDKNKLPYMAMLRNLRNLLLSGISSNHHKKVANQIENKKSVMKSRQLPLQFFEAYKELLRLQKMTTESDKSDKKEDLKLPLWARNRKDKERARIKNVSDSVIEEYKNAVSKALEISSLHNLNPIPGKTLVICEISPCKKDDKSGKKLYETCLMTSLMCMKACEECKTVILCHAYDSELYRKQDDESFLDNLMSNCSYYSRKMSSVDTDAETSDINTSQLRNALESYLKPQTILKEKLDHVVFLHTSSDSSSDELRNVMSSFLIKYRQIVNPDLLYTDVNFGLSSKGFSDSSVSEKDLYLCGSSSSLVRFIADRSSGGQLACVENIDLKYNLPEISPSKKLLLENPNISSSEIVTPVISMEPKWHTVRIFVSSTFKDMLSERDLLLRYVFPELKQRAASIFVKIVEIDLRWGITEADSMSKRAAELCFIEAQKSDLFIGILGERYGTVYNFEPPDSPSLEWVKDCPSGLSITELEMHAAALRHPKKSRKKAFFYFRDNSFIRHVPQKWVNHFNSEDVESKVKIDSLKEKIKSAGFKVFDSYPCYFAGIFENKPILGGLDALGSKVLEDLWTSIKAIHEDLSVDAINEEELYQQNLINSLNFFVGRKDSPLDSVISKLQSVEGIIVIAGAAGSGKTAFCIELLKDKDINNYVIAKYFIGISPRSRDICYMIQNICLSICHQLSLSISLPILPEDVVNNFSDFLVEVASCSGGKDIVLVIDGLDRLEPNDQRLDWLPLFFPNKIKLVCAVSENSQAFDVLVERKDRGNSIFFETISPLKQSDRELFIKNYLGYYQKTLDESAFNNHLIKIVTKKDSSNPLYLRIICDFLRIYGSFENLMTIVQKLPSSLSFLLQEIILQMENEFGTTLVQTVLSILCICKLGVEDGDLHYVLSFIMNMNKEKSSLSFDNLKNNIYKLEPENFLSQVKYCALMHIIITFAYGLFRQSSFTLTSTEFENAVKKFYLNKNYDSNCKYLHTVLAAYYHSLCDIDKSGKYSCQSGFTMRALLYHMFEGNLYKELCDLLCNLQFLESVFRVKADDKLLEYYSSILFDILENNPKISREIDDNRLSAFYDFVSRSFHIFHRYPQLVMQQALNEPQYSVVRPNKERLNRYTLENLSLSQACTNRLATLCGFSKNITASLGGRETPFVFLGTEDGYLKVLDVSTRMVSHSMKGHFSAITSICYAGKNRICVSSVDGTLSLWDSQDFKRINVLKGHRQHVTSCCADPSGCTLFSSGWDNSVRLWSLRDGRPISAVEDFKCPINCIDHHPMKQQIVCGLWNGSIEILDTISMEKKNVFLSTSGSVKSISYTPDGVNIISCFIQCEILILSSEEGLKMSSLNGHLLPVNALSFSHDDSVFISGSEDCTLKVWSSNSGSCFSSIDECKFCPITVMEFISEAFLAVAFQNSDIWIIDINNGKPRSKFYLSSDMVSSFSKYSSVSFEKDILVQTLNEESVIFGTVHGKLMIGNLLSNTVDLRHEMESKITALLHNTDFILCGTADGDIGLFSYSCHPLFKIVPGAHKGFLTDFCWDIINEDLLFLSSANDNVLKLWKVSRLSLDFSLENEFYNKHKDAVTCSFFPTTYLSCFVVGFEPTMYSFFTGSHDNNVILWNETSMKTYCGLHSSVLKVARFGEYVVGCGNDGAVVIWSLKGQVLSSVPGIEQSSTSLTFHIAEGENDSFAVLLAYIENDGSIKLTKPLERTFSCSLDGHTKPITTCCTAQNGEIVSCSLDGSINIWRAPVDTIKNDFCHSFPVTGVIISSSCNFALSSDAVGNIILWGIDLVSATSPLVYIAKKSFADGYIGGLSWLRNNRFICAVTQTIDSEEKFFLATFSVESCVSTEDTTFNLKFQDFQSFEEEISCIDSCAETDVFVIGFKSGNILVHSETKQKCNKMSDDWLLGVHLFTREKRSDFFCAAFISGQIKLFSIADFLDAEVAPVTPFAVYEPNTPLNRGQLTSTLCCGLDRMISSGNFNGVLKVYSKHSLKFSEKVHDDSITGICIIEPYMFTCSTDRTLKVWNLSSFKQVCQFHFDVPFSCMATLLYSTESNDNILILGTSSGEVQLLKFHPK